MDDVRYLEKELSAFVGKVDAFCADPSLPRAEAVRTGSLHTRGAIEDCIIVVHQEGVRGEELWALYTAKVPVATFDAFLDATGRYLAALDRVPDERATFCRTAVEKRAQYVHDLRSHGIVHATTRYAQP